MKNGKFGFGLVGLGMGGETHAREIKNMKEGELIAVYGRNPEKAKKFAETFGAKRWYADFRRMLDDKEVDIVNVLTPNGLHRDFAVAAAEAGKHLIVEKPIEITLERADAIINACRKHKVKLAVIYQMRFGNAVRKLKQAVDAGVFGKLILGDAYDKAFRTHAYYANDYWRGTKEIEGGGSVITQAIHAIDLLQWLMGPVSAVYAKKKTATHKVEVEDLAVAVVTFRNGALGVIESSTSTYPALKSRIEVHGENGSAIVNGEYDEMLYWNVANSDEKTDVPQGFQFGDISDPRLFPEVRHRYEFEDVIDAIKKNRDPLVSGEEGRKSLAIVHAIYRSAESGKEETVEA